MTAPSYDVVVLGAGLAGSSSARALAARGHRVLLLEALTVGHPQGSSHGTSRIYRRAYPDPFYVALTGRADAAWEALEEAAGVSLRTRTGGLDTGPDRAEAVRAALCAAGIECALLAPDDAGERWPGMVFEHPVLFHPDAGHLDADATVRAQVDVAVGLGAELWETIPALRVEQHIDGTMVHTAAGPVRASYVVVAAGPWLPDLLGDGLGVVAPVPELVVRQQEVFHFAHLDPTAVWPTLVHKGEAQLYGLPSGADGGSEPAMKIGRFDTTTVTTATTRDGVIDPLARAVVVDHAKRWLPGLDPEPVAEQSCLFTMTSDEDFVLDRADRVVIASPCSGHGAKFAPLLGELVADLVEGGAPEPRFAFRRA